MKNKLRKNNQELAWLVISAIQNAICHNLEQEFKMFYLSHRRKGHSVFESIEYANLEWDLI